MNVIFVTRLVLEAADDPEDKLWVVREDFRVSVDFELFIVPEGYITDLASVPRVPLAYWLAGGRARKAAVFHDYLYSIKKPKAFADLCFYHGMRREGVSWPVANLMYAAVAAFGRGAYDAKSEPLNELPGDAP